MRKGVDRMSGRGRSHLVMMEVGSRKGSGGMRVSPTRRCGNIPAGGVGSRGVKVGETQSSVERRKVQSSVRSTNLTTLSISLFIVGRIGFTVELHSLSKRLSLATQSTRHGYARGGLMPLHLNLVFLGLLVLFMSILF